MLRRTSARAIRALQGTIRGGQSDYILLGGKLQVPQQKRWDVFVGDRVPFGAGCGFRPCRIPWFGQAEAVDKSRAMAEGEGAK